MNGSPAGGRRGLMDDSPSARKVRARSRAGNRHKDRPSPARAGALVWRQLT